MNGPVRNRAALYGWLKRRADFVALRRAQRTGLADLTILSAPRPPAGDAGTAPRFGITVTRQTANAVGRNRIRRRLREAIRLAAGHARPGYDHVLIARQGVLGAPFARLVEQIVAGLDRAARSGDRAKPNSAGPAHRRRMQGAGRN